MKTRLIPFLFILLISFSNCPVIEEVEFDGVDIYMNGQKMSSSVTIQKGQTAALKAAADNDKIKDLVFVWEISNNSAAIINSGVGEEVLIRGENVNMPAGAELKVRAWRAGTDRQRTKPISLFVTEAASAEGIAGISGPQSISVNEERILSAELIPSWASGDVTWSASATGIVSLNAIQNSASCTVKGIAAGEVTITAATGDFSKTFNLQVTPEKTGNPVTAVRVKFSAAENGVKLPVSNTIWLFPGDSVALEAETTGGAPSSIIWTTENPFEVKVNNTESHTGAACTLTGIYESEFNSLPSVVRVTALNSGNENPVSAQVLVKTQAKPVWAWDRGRDGNLNTALPQVLSSNSGDTSYVIKGRGEYAEKTAYLAGIPVKAKGNFIPYTASGLKLNSSNNFSGDNPDPVKQPDYGNSATSYNSTRITFGTNLHANTDSNVHQDGIFDFLTPNRNFRISVDYEIIWSAGASRDMWIMANNNNANAAQSYMGTNSQLLIEPLIAARGTRATAVTTLDVRDLVDRGIKGSETLGKAFIAVIALSNGGSIYVSGVRIEYE